VRKSTFNVNTYHCIDTTESIQQILGRVFYMTSLPNFS
jgi:hypothetical protein